MKRFKFMIKCGNKWLEGFSIHGFNIFDAIRRDNFISEASFRRLLQSGKFKFEEVKR